jgi:hypothetical protein
MHFFIFGSILITEKAFKYTDVDHKFAGAGIAQWYSTGLRARWSGVQVPVGDGNLSIHHRLQTGSEARPASYPMDTRSSFPGGKAVGRESDHSTPSSDEVKNAWRYASTPQYAFKVWCSVKKHRDNFTFTLTFSIRLHM